MIAVFCEVFMIFAIIEFIFLITCVIYVITNKKVLQELNQRLKFLEEKINGDI